MKEEIALCDGMIDAIHEVEAKKKAQAAAVATKDQTNVTNIGDLRTRIARHKNAKAISPEIQKILGIATISLMFDKASYKAILTAEMFAGFVRLKFKKAGTDGVNIYHRKKRDATWHFLARDTKSPYDDHIVLVTPGQPEHWEYRAYGVIDDSEIGQPSDIVEVVFGG